MGLHKYSKRQNVPLVARKLRQLVFASMALFIAGGCATLKPRVDVVQPVQGKFESLEIPSHNRADRVLTRIGYTVLFDGGNRVPKWVAFKLNRISNSLKNVEREDAFRKDEDVENCPSPAEYLKSGYDRGHLAPAEDMRWSDEAMRDSFLMSNMTPQTPRLNRGAWKSLETFLRNRMNLVDEIFVVAGPVLSEPCERYIGKSICVPSRHFKVFLEVKGAEYRAMGFLMPQVPEKDYMEHAVSVDEVERITGFDFFSRLPDDVENGVESVSFVRAD